MSDWILLPVYNEAATLGPLLDQIYSQGYRALVVDDGSSDDSAQIAARRGCRVLRLGTNQGKGAALKRGFEFLRTQPSWDVVVLMDSDGQHDPREIGKFFRAHRRTDADVVVGTRMQAKQDMPWIRYVTNRVTSRCVSALAGQRIEDSQCGFRSLRRHVVLDLQLTCDRFDLESEMLIQAGDKGYKISSVPVRSIYRDQPSRIRPLADTLRFCKLLARYGSLLPWSHIPRARKWQPAGAADPV